MAFLGEIQVFAGSEPPTDWVFCDGQFLLKDEYAALFSVIKTTYGSDGKDKFAVPNLIGRVPIGTGKNIESGRDYGLAEYGGREEVVLSAANIPAHEHKFEAPISVNNKLANNKSPEANYFSNTGGDLDYSDTADGTMNKNVIVIELGQSTVGETRLLRPINNMQPYVAMNYIICVNGPMPNSV